MPVTPLCMADTMNPVEIDISAGGNLQEDDDNFKQTQTLAMICEQYPPEVWTNVYTDGSATNAIHVLPFTSLAAAQKQPVQQQEDTKQLQSIFRGIDDDNLSCCGLTTQEHHGCISH